MLISEQLKPFLPSAKKLLKENAIREVEFSGGTYQVRFTDEKQQKDYWAFLQLDDKGEIRDSFCSCHEEDVEDVSFCVHIAASYMYICAKGSLPLHLRFEISLWNRLCQLFSERLGYEAGILKKAGKSQFDSKSVGGKKVFSIKATSAKASAHLSTIILHRHRETEETSLKFSNLSQEEILLWREGRPSLQLSYELSFWNDLAKWFFILQESDMPYQISFEYSGRHLPNSIFIKFQEVEALFYLSEANLPVIIPALATVNSPLKVHDPDQEGIECITYDKSQGCLLITPKPGFTNASRSIENPRKGYSIGQWLFIENDGFYPKDPEGLLSNLQLCGKDINRMLTDHREDVKRFLTGVSLHTETVPASYSLAFDNKWNLHINCYVFHPGDLESGDSRYFGDWVYLNDDGFYRLVNKQFEDLETIIPQDQVVDFVRQNRSWLNLQEGFETHLVSIESQLTYSLSDDNKLTFVRQLQAKEDLKGSKDFGAWIYIPGQGFYSKMNIQIGLPVRPGITFGQDQIPVYIRSNQAELTLVPNFFSEQCPVSKSGLVISLTDHDTIQVAPHYELLPEYRNKDVRFFDDFVYVKGEGFHELPVDSRLPDRFRHGGEIGPSDYSSFFNYELQKLKPFTISIDPRLIAPYSLRLMAARISKDDHLGKGWYQLKLGYHTDRGTIPVADIWAALKKKKHYLFAEAGLIDLKQKRFDWLRMLAKNRIDKRSNTLTLSTLELIRLNAFDEIEMQRGKGKDYDTSLQLLHELTDFKIPNEPVIDGLNSSLRPYQKAGLNWLWFLYHYSLSGLLCDDMGLGKTHQSMALLAAVVNLHRTLGESSRRHFLIICPTSVIYHWQEKLENFLPSVKVCTFHGSGRSLKDFKQDYDILLTSYGIWRMETELLSKVPFEVAIFDEIQIAKNHHSRIYASLTRVNAQMRIGLTGTPIENHLRELKTLFDLTIPTYMPGDSDYRDFFIRPIEKEHNQERKELLSRFIKPFMLRRKKDQVLLDLPEKTEEVAHCELIDTQERLYMEILEQSRQRVLADLKDDGKPIPYMHIFAILSALKQICDHPAVYLKTPHDYKSYSSGKWELFIELLNEARESEQKVVVFSQYLGMLDIMESYLNEMGIGYATIRGSTANRGEQIHRFNHDPNCEVFIGSLQAAGLGVDLTAGSVVIHYDRWWNAARENQATDRVHRIGQKRGVQVFKLVTKHTLEERIDRLIFRKGKLMEEIIGVDDHQIIKQFSRSEIIELLQYVKT